MTKAQLGVVMNGVTGRMGYRQHLERSILAIREQGGVELRDGSRVQLDPILVGRNEQRLRDVAERHGVQRWTTDLNSALTEPDAAIYFDAQATSVRAPAVHQAIDAGKHVYTEKPLTERLDEAVELVHRARSAGICNGVVHDKLFLPGFLKLQRLVEGGFFGRILSVVGRFGYWVFEGDWQQSQRPSWNYRAEDGGGVVVDMFCHWHYVLEQLFGPVRAVTAHAVTHIPKRWDEHGEPYEASADDAAYAIFELEGGIVAQINSSWCVRVYRDELVEFQVDGTDGSAVAGLFGCRVQDRVNTPKAVWDPDVPTAERFRDQWLEVPDNGLLDGGGFDNGFKMQWEQFVRHICDNEPHPYDFASGVRGIQLAEAGLRSSAQGRRIELEDLGL